MAHGGAEPIRAHADWVEPSRRSRRLGGTGPDLSLELVEPQTGPTATGDDMQPGEVLNPDQDITSAGGRFSFVYLSDGDLVLYGPAGALWASNTHDQPVGGDYSGGRWEPGDLRPGGTVEWASNTGGNRGARLVAQNDGTVVSWRTDATGAWDTGTVQP